MDWKQGEAGEPHRQLRLSMHGEGDRRCELPEAESQDTQTTKGDIMRTLDELLEKHPAPWTSLAGIAFDATHSIVPTTSGVSNIEMTNLLVASVNRIHEMRGEMDALKADNDS